MTAPTRTQACLETCHQCMGNYSDGKQDCENPRCPLYYFMPYRKLEADLWWMKINPKKVGRVLKTRATKTLSSERKAALCKALETARHNRKEQEND